jgi:DNA-binding response OmpR family regulator
VSAQVLCIEDDPDIALAVRLALRRAGLTVIYALTARTGCGCSRPSAPRSCCWTSGCGRDGWGVLERIREQDDCTPVLMLTAHGLAADQFRGLHSGADDYLVKPFSNAELIGRVQSLLKQARAARPGTAQAYQDARLQVDFAAAQVTVDGQPVQLTPGEFRVLATLVRKAGEPVPAGVRGRSRPARHRSGPARRRDPGQRHPDRPRPGHLPPLLVGVAMYSSPGVPADPRRGGSSPKALAGSTPAPYRSSSTAARSAPVLTWCRARSHSRHGLKSGYR